MTLSMASADRLYHFTQTRVIQYHRVRHDPFESFCRLSRRFLGLVRESEADDEYWTDFSRALVRYRFALQSSPLKFDNPVVRPRMSVEMTRELVRRASLVYPSTAGAAREVMEQLHELLQCADNPLGDCLERIALTPTSAKTAVMIRESRLIRPTQEALFSREATREFEAVGISALRAAADFSRLIVLGPSRWFPDHIFSAPRVPSIEVVSFRWNRCCWRPQAVFLGGVQGMQKEEEVHDEESDIGVEEAWPEVDWVGIAQRATQPFTAGQDYEDHERVEARLYSLRSGYAVFLEAADGSSSLVIDLEEDDESRVKRVKTENLVPGMFVLLRTEGGGDYVAAIADRLLGDRASPYRTAQKAWKSKLRVKVSQGDLLSTSIQLLELGSNRANEGNLRNWLSERSIRTQDKRDFLAILRLIELEKEVDGYWGMMGEIQTAHHRAGQIVRDRLLDLVRAADISKLETKGRMDFSLPEVEGGQLTAFLVEGRAPTTTQVPASRCGRPFIGEE